MGEKNLKKPVSSSGNLSIGTILTQICKEYRDKILEKAFNIKKTKPWMKYREIEIIEEILKNLQPQKALEWGSGYSTTYFPKILNENAMWLSVEHDEKWATKVKNVNRNPSVEIFHVHPNHFPWTDKFGDGAYSDLINYVEFPSKFGNFDFILIDGRARKDCLVKAYELVKDNGVVVLHDATREYYHEPFKLYKHQVLFQDYRKDGSGLWVGSKGIDIKVVLDVDKHRKVWQIYDKVGKVLKYKVAVHFRYET